MERKRRTLSFLLGALTVQIACSSSTAVELTGSLRIHDPSRIHKQDGRYYVYGTGSSPGGNSLPISARYSDDFAHWQDGPAVFSGIPAWADGEVPNNPNFMWAPDVFHFNNEYRLYYSVSSFGSQNSVIGMATNSTLDFNDPGYAWVDQGMVIESENGASYNAIDAGIFYDDAASRMWMTFGSFWNGIYITELDPATGKRITPTSTTTSIARHTPVPPNAIEAPFLTKHDGFYYLFVNWDTCCQGSNSTYKIRVGRGTSPTGPFRGRAGLTMTSGAGDPFLATEGSEIGPGHFSEYSEDGKNYFSYHYYDGADQGRSKLAIEEFVWAYDGWPVPVSDLATGDYNRNGIVDAADYTVWRNTLGSTDDLRANGDDTALSAGVVDAADYLAWRNNYGTRYALHFGAGAGELAVPEPSTSCIAGLGASFLFLRRRRG